MKKVLLIITILMIGLVLTGCKDRENNDELPEIDPNNFTTRYVISAYFEEDTLELIVDGSIFYKNEIGDINELYLNVFPNAGSVNTDNVKFKTLEVKNHESNFRILSENRNVVHMMFEDVILENEIIEIEFDMSFHLWNDGRIFGSDDYVHAMFFYPFVAMYDDGWVLEEYTFRGETYYNEMGDYYISLNLPKNFEVATPGEITSHNRVYGRELVEVTHLQARDYSFSASPNYSVYEKTINGIDFSIFSIEELSTAKQYEVFGYLEDGFRVYEDAIGDYYYDYFVLELGRTFGMESSGIIYCSSEISEWTIAHEIVHQWFFFMIGNDQYNESFLDESLTSWATALYFRDQMAGDEGYYMHIDRRSSSLERLQDRYQQSLGHSLLQNVNEFGELYAFLIYYHGPTLIDYYIQHFLNGDIDLFVSYMKLYYDTYVGENVSVDEFLDFLELQSGVENTKEWFLFHLNEFQPIENTP